MGYANKQMCSSFQSIVADKKGTDCGTKKCIKMLLTNDNYKLFKYRYIKEKSGNLVLLNDDNKDKYIGKIVEFRSPMYCKGDKICNKCAGELYQKLGIDNIGLLTITIGGSILNKSMKAFHNSTIKLTQIAIEDYISD